MSVVSSRLSDPASSMFTHAVTPLENFTSLQLEEAAEEIENPHQRTPITTNASMSFFICFL